MTKRIVEKKNIRNKGFTLVELVVVLVLLTILISLSVVGLLSWQDYSQFKQENANAETIFYAVQNQFMEYSSGGCFEEKVTKRVEALDNHKVASPDNIGPFDGGSVLYGSKSNGEYYKWEPDGSNTGIAIWGNTPSSVDEIEKKKYQGSIYYISAEKGDYDKYLSKTLGDDKEDTKLLFDIISTYISEKSILNGAILVEFSPEAEQVFSVCYSDKCSKLDYQDGTGVISVLDRSYDRRYEVQLGYYAADSLSKPLVGRNKSVDNAIELRNGNTLDLVIIGQNFNSTTVYSTNIYYASNGEKDTDRCLASFRFSVGNAMSRTSLAAAASDPLEVDVRFEDNSTGKLRIPVWYDSAHKEIHIVLDAADAQAQSYLYKLYKDPAETDKSFINTYSFYRFGFDMSSIRQICCGVIDNKGADEVFSNIESPCYAYVDTVKETDAASGINAGAIEYGISNGRHLYNVRFETDYKTSNVERVFRLTNDIDWAVFTGKKADETGEAVNSYLTSYRNGTDTNGRSFGIGFDGLDYSINRPESGNIGPDNALDTSNYAFPGFRALGAKDIFTGKKITSDSDSSNDGGVDADSDDCWTISNLTITYAANMAYGVYGGKGEESARDMWNKTGYYETSEYDLADYGKYSEPATGAEIHPAHVRANKGLYPLGLFAENDGSIQDLALNAHRVIGMELLKTNVNGDTVALVYTNMVGGFAGNNLGKMSNLKLRDVTDLSNADIRANEAGVTFVNGKTDVGGIVGRESWTISSTGKAAQLINLENYGKVTGMENVGGIVGRAYVIREYYTGANYAQDIEGFKARFRCYNDGYDIYGKFDEETGKLEDGKTKSITGKNVYVLTSINIENCISHGEVRGDDLIYEKRDVFRYDDKYYVYKTYSPASEIIPNVDYSNKLYRCANIGGIAGITMDGYYTDFNNTVHSTWFSYSLQNNASVVLKNCNAYRLYSDSDLSFLKSNSSGGKLASAVDDSNAVQKAILGSLEHDYYKGGLVGYSRLTRIINCGNEVSGDETGNYKAFVFGRNYAGGLFGCFDASKISSVGDNGQEKLIENRYNIVNNTNVIGVMNVGGCAGGMGIGDESQEYFSFKYPSCNEGSTCSQTKVPSGKIQVSGIKNTGLVLGIKRESLDYGSASNPGLIWDQDYDIAYNQSNENKNKNTQYSYQGIGLKQKYASPSGPDSNVGGVVGSLRLSIKYADNIQSDDTKKYMLSLIGINKNYDAVSYDDLAAVWSTSFYGGNSVGGIAGKVHEGSAIGESNTAGVVNAVVYGTDAVGGVAGSGISGDNNVVSTLDHALVLGRDMVGGFIGNENIKLNNKNTLNNEYYVIGRYAVGGAIGTTEDKAANFDISNAHVSGKAYVGGYAGLASSNSGNFDGSVSDTEVNAEFFAGGVIGACYTSRNDTANYNLSKIKVGVSKVSVKANAFAGGVVGLYAHHYDSTNKNQNLMVEIGETYNYAIISDQKRVSTHPLVELGNALISSDDDSALYDVIDSIVASENVGALKYDSNNNPSNAELALNVETLGLSQTSDEDDSSVEAKIFAGGVFGYIPDGFKKLSIDLGITDPTKSITVKVTTTSTVTATGLYNEEHRFGETVILSNNGYGGRKLSYAGGVIGRIPNGVTVKQAAYSGELSGASGEATYLGQIAEVNAGTINASTIMSFNIGNSSYDIMGGLTGLNTETGYISGDGSTTAKPAILNSGITLTGSRVLGGLIGENWGDFIITGEGTSSEDRSLNGWAISDSDVASIGVGATGTIVEDSALGLVAGINHGKVDIKNSSVNATKLTGAESVGAYFGINYGEVYNSAVASYREDYSIEGEVTGEEDFRYALMGDKDGAVKISVRLFANKADFIGLISGNNLGTIRDISLSDASCSLLLKQGDKKAEYTYAGAVTGKISSKSNFATIEHCFNFTNIGSNASTDGSIAYAAGIVGVAGGATEISGCDNHGDLYGTRAAAGILAWTDSDVTGDGTVRINDCSNTGSLGGAANTNKAGIAAFTNGTGSFYLCRNYGVGADYGISTDDVYSVKNSLEASGLSERSYDNYNPIAPVEDKTTLERDFYIHGTYDADQGTGETVGLDDITNDYNVWFTMSSSNGTVPSDKLQSLYNRTDSLSEYADQNTTVWIKNPFRLRYDINTNGAYQGVRMKDFTLVWYRTYNIDTNFKYSVTIEYESGSGVSGSFTTTERVYSNNNLPVYDTISLDDIPRDSFVKSVIINGSNPDTMIKNEKDQVIYSLYSAYWRDSDGKHYIYDEDHKSNPHNDHGKVSFLATYNNSKEFVAAGLSTDPAGTYSTLELYDVLPSCYINTDIDGSPEVGARSRHGKYLGLGEELSVQIDVNNPGTGLEMDSFRIYWYNFARQWSSNELIHFKYKVFFDYYDIVGRERTVSYERNVSPPADSKDSAFYDDIPARDADNNKIKPIRIRIVIEHDPELYVWDQGNNRGYWLHYHTMTYIDDDGEHTFTRNLTASENTVITPNSVNEESGVITYGSNTFVRGIDSIDKVTGNDNWPKQLLVRNRIAGESEVYDLIYTKYGVKRGTAISGLNGNPVSAAYTSNKNYRLQLYHDIDRGFRNFVTDVDTYPNSDFIDVP